MDIKFNYDGFLIMDCEKFLSISHCFFPVSSCKNRIMLSVPYCPCPTLHATRPQVRLVACTRMWIYPVVHSLILKWPSGRANPGTHVHVLQTHVTIMR